MDPTDWQYTHQRMNAPRCGYYSVKDNKRPHTMMGTNEELENHHTPSSHRHNMSYRLNSNNLNPEMVTSSSDPDSEPEELSEIDKELARKRRELKQIEKQILCKEATTIAMKTATTPLKSILKTKTAWQMTTITTTGAPLKSILKAKTPCQMMFKEDLSSKVDSSVRNTLPFMNTGEKDVGFSCNQQPSAYSDRSLKERVDGIVQQRKAWKGTTAFSTPTDHLPPPNPVEKTSLDYHPLKLRVKALMNRHRNYGLLDSHHGEIFVKPQPPSQSPATTVVEKNSAVKGFQHFLSVLNKGVNIEMLNRIVIDDNEHPPPTGQGLLHSSQTPVVKDNSEVCESDSQRLLCGGERRSRSAERMTKLLNQHISIEACKGNIQREEKSAQSDDGGERHFGSRHRFRLPPVVEAKKPKQEQHQGDLQNILKTIGFSMDADDMCKLANRTQKRLYGIENETKLRLDGPDGTAPSKRSQQLVRNDHGRSSSSTSVSDRPSSSPSRHQHSPSKTSRDRGAQTQSSECGLNFRQRSKERGSREQMRERDGDKNRIASRDDSTGPDAACVIPMYNSDAAFAIPSYTSVRHSVYSACHSDTSNCASLDYGSSDIPPSSSSPAFCNYSMIPLCPSADTGALDGHDYPHPHPPAGYNDALGHSCLNSDLSLTETEGLQRQQLEVDSECTDDIAQCYRPVLHPITKRKRKNLKKALKDVRQCIAQAKSNPKHNPEWIQKQLAAKEQGILMILNQNSGLSLSEGQTGQPPLPHNLHINPQCQTKLTDMKLQTKQPAERIHGQESSNEKKELDTIKQDSDLSLSEGQTGRQSDLCYLRIISTVQDSEYTDYHRDTSNGVSSRAWNDVSNDIPPSSSCPPSLCNSINLVRPSADTGALLGQGYRPHPPAGYNDALGHSCLNSDLSLTETGDLQGQQLGVDSEYIDFIAVKYRQVLRSVKGRPLDWLPSELKRVRQWIALANIDPKHNSEYLKKRLAAKEQYLLMILNQSSDLSLIKGQTGQQSAINTNPISVRSVGKKKRNTKEERAQLRAAHMEEIKKEVEEIKANLMQEAAAAAGAVSTPHNH